MHPELFEKFRLLIESETGIHLPIKKMDLLRTRMARRIYALGLQDEKTYYDYVTDPKNAIEVSHFIDAVATNVTHFYREPAHFHVLADELKKMARQGASEIRMWSAACSSGEEAYTLAIVASEALRDTATKFKVLATDISTRVLETAARGLYTSEDLKGLPRTWILRHFDKSATQYRVSPELREKVMVRRLNLTSFPLPLQGPLDVIFCRNVLIYFERDLRRKIVGEMQRLLRPGGLLVLSHTESLAGIGNFLFDKVAPSVYRRNHEPCFAEQGMGA